MKIILIGFMGSGKTTVSKKLGKKLGLRVIEMDELVLEISKRKSISEIFSLDGEIKFRLLESQIADQLSDMEDVIISTGGGVVTNKTNINSLKKNGKVIFLKTSFQEIKKRLKNSQERPLFKDKISAEKLFNFRQNLYNESTDLIIETDKKSVKEVVNEIISQN